MMSLKSVMYLLLVLLTVACSKTDEPKAAKMPNVQTHPNFLTFNEPTRIKSVNIKSENANESGLLGRGTVIEVSNLKGASKYVLTSLELDKAAIKDQFYVNLCDKQLLGIVFISDEQYEHITNVNYYIYLINIKDGTLFGEFYKTERKDDITGKVINSDNTDNFITVLKAGGNPDFALEEELPSCSIFELEYKPRLVHNNHQMPLFLASGETPAFNFTMLPKERGTLEPDPDQGEKEPKWAMLQLTNKHGEIKLFDLNEQAIELHSIRDSFYSKFCGQDVLVVTVQKSWLESVIYRLFVINLEGGLVEEIIAGADERISTLAKLKADQHSEYLCKYLLQ